MMLLFAHFEREARKIGEIKKKPFQKKANKNEKSAYLRKMLYFCRIGIRKINLIK